MRDRTGQTTAGTTADRRPGRNHEGGLRALPDDLVELALPLRPAANRQWAFFLFFFRFFLFFFFVSVFFVFFPFVFLFFLPPLFCFSRPSILCFGCTRGRAIPYGRASAQ